MSLIPMFNFFAFYCLILFISLLLILFFSRGDLEGIPARGRLPTRGTTGAKLRGPRFTEGDHSRHKVQSETFFFFFYFLKPIVFLFFAFSEAHLARGFSFFRNATSRELSQEIQSYCLISLDFFCTVKPPLLPFFSLLLPFFSLLLFLFQ